MTHSKALLVGRPVYTGPGRIRPTPQVGPRCGEVKLALANLSSAGAGNGMVGLVPDSRPGPADVRGTAAPWSSQARSATHLPSGDSTRTEGEPPMEPTHGTLTTYVNHPCRCTPCAAASAEYARTRTRLRAYGLLEDLVDVETVARHLAWLSSQGVGRARTAELAGVGESTIARILRPGAVSRGVTPRVARAILAVTPNLDTAFDHALVDATGTRRRLEALARAGWSLKAIEAQLALVRLDRVLRRDLVTARVARSIRAFYDSHWSSPPPAHTASARAHLDKTRARAERNGWLPALAWDEDTIDDPTVTAPTDAVRTPTVSTRIHLEDVVEMVSLGASWAELETRTGACRNSIEVALRRSGQSRLVSRITSNRWVAA